MARARNIKPAIMDNESLADMAPLTRLLFIYLWMLADREGRLEDRPKRIAAQALPYDRDADIDAMLSELTAAGFIARYQVGSNKFIQIVNFVKHQNPHGTERDSEIPDENGITTVYERTKNGYYAKEAKHIDNSGLTVKEQSDNALIPDSLIPDSYSVPNGTDAAGVEKPKLSPDEIIFGYGVPLLTNAGSSEKQARSFLGGLRKQHGDPAVIDKLRDCLREKPLQPLEWLAAALPPKGAGPPKVQSFRERDTAAASARYRSLTGKESPVVIDIPTMKAIAQ